MERGIELHHKAIERGSEMRDQVAGRSNELRDRVAGLSIEPLCMVSSCATRSLKPPLTRAGCQSVSLASGIVGGALAGAVFACALARCVRRR
jgi:hypothetical protein